MVKAVMLQVWHVRRGLFALGFVMVSGCPGPSREPAPPREKQPAAVLEGPRPPLLEPPKLTQPVALWEHGKVAREVDAERAPQDGFLILDLGEAWTPYLFTDGYANDGTPRPSAYRPVYQALARGEYPDNYQGERAKEDKYLELYGILPTLHLLRERAIETGKLACAAALDLGPLQSFTGLATYDSNTTAKKRADDFVYLRSRVHDLMQSQHVDLPERIDTELLAARDKDVVVRYMRQAPEYLAVDAMQKRLACEGYFKTRGKYTHGAIDWATHDALAEFERRHRVFSWGYLGRDSLLPLSVMPVEAERSALVRVLEERAMHAMGVLEDGSVSTLDNGEPRLWKGVDGKEHPIPNLLAVLGATVVEAFGLQTPQSALGWLNALGELPKGEHRFVAVRAPVLPEYYNGDMQLTLDYERGDVWYDFPYDDHGVELPQPVQRRPQVTVSVLYNEQKIPLARYGTTIGGWRTENVDGNIMWKYKDSPPGPRAWEEIVAAPVWLPPDSTPPKDLLKKNRKKLKEDDPDYLVNYHETGPSYASAYGLVAAYHRTYFKRADGRVQLGNDEGIRTHGSVDYMSIMRRHSHGCHRLHNHIALRLMSFVLAHRPHQRLGQEKLNYKKIVPYEEKEYLIDIPDGGYVFVLDIPLFVNVEEGRIRGQVKAPIEFAIPKYNEEVGAYVMPDGTGVQVRGDTLVPVPLPLLPDGGVPMVPIVPSAIPGAMPATPGAVPTVLHVDTLPASVPGKALPPTAAAKPAAPLKTLPPPVPGQ